MKCSIRDLNKFYFKQTDCVGEAIYDYGNLSNALMIIEESSKDIRITFRLKDSIVIEDLINLVKLDRDIVFLIEGNYNYLDELNKNNIPFYFSYGLHVATSFDDIRCLAAVGAIDVFISGKICFDLKNTRAVADECGVNLRIVPNLSQSSSFNVYNILDDTKNLTAFWVRPNDIDLYGQYIDFVEFAGLDTKQNVFYDIYFIAKHWHGRLNEIIAGLQNEVDNRGLPEEFGKFRIKCNKACSLNRQCHHCIRCKYISDLKLGKIELEDEGV